MAEIRDLQKEVVKFRDERDWAQFHNPKDSAISLALEAAEVLEHFQWKSADEMKAHVATNKVECICNGIVCAICKTNVLHRPVSNYYDLASQKVWHAPYFKSICTECNVERHANVELEKYYEEKRAYFAILSDAELIELKRKSRSNPGWVPRRAYYETALTEELQRRGLQLPE